MEAHEHEYGRQVHPGSNRLGVFLCLHLKCIRSSLSNSVCCTCLLLLLLLCLAAALTLLQHRGKEGKRGCKFLEKQQKNPNTAQHPPGTAAGRDSPADGSGRLKSSSELQSSARAAPLVPTKPSTPPGPHCCHPSSREGLG